jgi:hypothetical protein
MSNLVRYPVSRARSRGGRSVIIRVPTPATASLDLSAETGLATAAGGTVALDYTLTAAAGAATAGGGTVRVAVGLTAATGTATAGGGDVSLSVETLVPMVTGRGRYGRTISAIDRPVSYLLTRVSSVIGGLEPAAAAALNLDASSGAATAGGGTVTLEFAFTATGGTATAGGGTVALAAGLTATGGTATATGGTVSLSVGLVASAGTAIAGGGDVSLTVVLTATGGGATAGGGDVTLTVAPLAPPITAPGVYGRVVRAYTRQLQRLTRVSSILGGLQPPTAGVLNLDASGGTATASGGDVTLSITGAGLPPAAVVPGGSVGVTRGPRRVTARPIMLGSRLFALVEAPTAPAATAQGGTVSLTFVYSASGGNATAAGGTVSAGAGANVSATGGTASAVGGTLSLAFTYALGGGMATAGGGTVTVSGVEAETGFVRVTSSGGGDWVRVTSTGVAFSRLSADGPDFERDETEHDGGFTRVNDEAGDRFTRV